MKKSNILIIFICLFLTALVITAVVITHKENERKEKVSEKVEKTEELTEAKTEDLIISDKGSDSGEDIIAKDGSDTASLGDGEETAIRSGNMDKKSGASERVTYSDDGNTIYINDIAGDMYDYGETALYPNLTKYSCEIQNASVIQNNELQTDTFISFFYTFCTQRRYTLPEVIKMDRRELNEDINNYIVYYFTFETSNLEDGTATVDTTPFTAYAMAVLDNGNITIYDLTDDK